MGKILDDMTRLRENMDRGRAERMAGARKRADELSVLASGVVDMIGDFASARQVRFAADQAARGNFIDGLVHDVRDLEDEVEAMMSRVRDERVEKAREAATERSRDVAARADEIRNMLRGFQDEVEAFRDAFAVAADADARMRIEFVADKAHDVADMLGRFRRTHAERAAADADNRRDFVADIGSHVRVLQEAVASDLAGIRELFGGGARLESKPQAKSADPKPVQRKQPAAAESEPMQARHREEPAGHASAHGDKSPAKHEAKDQGGTHGA